MMQYFIYRYVLYALGPVLRLYLRLRVRLGKEDAARLSERYGIATRPRPGGRIIWLHAASIGEVQSVQLLIETLLQFYPGYSVLLTSGTKTSAKIMAEKTSARVLHQYLPLDHPLWVRRFIGYWRPELGVMVESELWPNLLWATSQARVPLLLVNARMSADSYANWRKSPGFIRAMLRQFSLVLAQDEINAGYYRDLGAPAVEVMGNLKFAARPLPFVPEELSQLQAATAGRLLWLAASTHAGEERMIATAHRQLQSQYPQLLTILVPRHPNRAAAIIQELQEMNLQLAQRSLGQNIDTGTQIYLADTIGEMGLWFALCPVVFMGNSLMPPGGGHNLLEPARYGRAILHGPRMQNFTALADSFQNAQAAWALSGPEQLIPALQQLWQNPQMAQAMGQRAMGLAQAEDYVLQRVVAAVQGHLTAQPA